MTKDVLVSVKGLQYSVGETSDDSRVETISRGTYYVRNGSKFILYEEIQEGMNEVTKNTIKIRPDVVDVNRKGPFSVHIVYEKGKKNFTNYHTPYGDLVIAIDTKKIGIIEEKEKMTVHVLYDMEVNYEHLATCELDIVVNAVTA